MSGRMPDLFSKWFFRNYVENLPLAKGDKGGFEEQVFLYDYKNLPSPLRVRASESRTLFQRGVYPRNDKTKKYY